MRKIVIFILLGMFVLLVIGESGILNTLLMFVLVGAIPGTTYAIPPGLMLVVITISAWLTLARFAVVNLPLRRLVKYCLKAKNIRLVTALYSTNTK